MFAASAGLPHVPPSAATAKAADGLPLPGASTGQPSAEVASLVVSTATWQEHFTETGESFYYNTLTGETVWTKPQEPTAESPKATAPAESASDSSDLHAMVAAIVLEQPDLAAPVVEPAVEPVVEAPVVEAPAVKAAVAMDTRVEAATPAVDEAPVAVSSPVLQAAVAPVEASKHAETSMPPLSPRLRSEDGQ